MGNGLDRNPSVGRFVPLSGWRPQHRTHGRRLPVLFQIFFFMKRQFSSIGRRNQNSYQYEFRQSPRRDTLIDKPGRVRVVYADGAKEVFMTISLRDIMSQHGPTGVAPRGGSLVTGASAMRRFNWTGDRFTIYPSRIRFEPHHLVQTGERDNMLSLLSNASFTAHVNSGILQPTTATAECDAFILAGDVLHEPMRGRSGGVVSYASSRPIPSNPPARVVGYIHSHPRSGGMRPPTPGSD